MKINALNQKAATAAKEFFGYVPKPAEINLALYVAGCSSINAVLDSDALSTQELKFLGSWWTYGWVSGAMDDFEVDADFYNAVIAIFALALEV